MCIKIYHVAHFCFFVFGQETALNFKSLMDKP